MKYATTPAADSKIRSPKKTIYTCGTGYTLDGKRNSAISFEVNCNADKNFEGGTECKPIECGTIKNVNDSQPTRRSWCSQSRHTWGWRF